MSSWRSRIVGLEQHKPSEIADHPQQWRTHPEAQRAALLAQIGEIGVTRPLIIFYSEELGQLATTDGHLRKSLDPNFEWPCLRLDVNDDEARQDLLFGDPLAAMAGADADVLAQLLAQIETDDAALQAVLDGLAEEYGILGDDPPDDPGAQIDKAAELQEKYGTALGQVWEIGEHRLVVGDCTDPAVVAAVMQGERAQLAVTSPPYGVGKHYEVKGIGPWFEVVRPAIKLLCQHAAIVVWNIVDLYCTGSQFIEPTMAYTINMFTECGYRTLWIRIWRKPGSNHGVAPYHLVSNKPVQEYEYLAAFGEAADALVTPGATSPDLSEFEWVLAFTGKPHRFVRRLDKADRKEWGYSGVWEMPTVRVNDDHPAMFPLVLPERALKMHSDVEDVVLDPFLGSGTTLVACERLGRLGRGIELDPGYCAVALERLQGMGLEPKLAGTVGG